MKKMIRKYQKTAKIERTCTFLIHVSLYVLLVGCGSSREATAPSTGQNEPSPIQAPAAETAPLSLAPLSAKSEAIGIKPLAHAPRSDDDHSIALDETDPKLTVVQPSSSTVIAGIEHRNEGDCWIGSSWEVNFGAGPLEDLLVKWIEVAKSGEVSITPPSGIEGVVMQLSGCHPDGGWTRKLVAVGEAGSRNYQAYRDTYLPKRLETVAPTFELPDNEIAKTVDVEPVVIFTADVDGDGKAEVLSYNVARWKDKHGDQLAEGGELGVIWSTGKPEVSFASFALDQGTIFPFLHVIPANLNGGALLLYGVLKCCGGTSYRAMHLGAQRQFEKSLFEAKDGDRGVFLEPSPTARAKINISR